MAAKCEIGRKTPKEQSQRCRERSVDIRREQGSTQDGSRDVGGGQRKEEGDGQKGRVSVGRREATAPAAVVYTGNSGQRGQRLREREISSDRTGTSDR